MQPAWFEPRADTLDVADPRPLVSIVVPVLDESATLPLLIERLGAVFGPRPERVEVIIVDDGSSPAQAVATGAIRSDRLDVAVVRLERNYGQATALVRGLRQARGSVVVTMDGDLQDLPEELPALLSGVERGAQVAKGSRRQLRMPWWRRWGSRMVTGIVGKLVGVELRDFGGQFIAYDASVVATLVSQWRPRQPLVPLACALGFDIREIDVDRGDRHHGRSRYGAFELAGNASDLVVDFGPRRLRLGIVGGAALVALVGSASRSRSVRLLALAPTAATTAVMVRRGLRSRSRDDHLAASGARASLGVS